MKIRNIFVFSLTTGAMTYHNDGTYQEEGTADGSAIALRGGSTRYGGLAPHVNCRLQSAVDGSPPHASRPNEPRPQFGSAPILERPRTPNLTTFLPHEKHLSIWSWGDATTRVGHQESILRLRCRIISLLSRCLKERPQVSRVHPCQARTSRYTQDGILHLCERARACRLAGSLWTIASRCQGIRRYLSIHSYYLWD